MKKLLLCVILLLINHSFVQAKQSSPKTATANPTADELPTPSATEKASSGSGQEPSKSISQSADTAMVNEEAAPLMKNPTPEMTQIYAKTENDVKVIEQTVHDIEKIRSELRDMYYKLSAEIDSFLQKSGIIVGQSKEIYSDLVHDSLQKLVKEHGLRAKN